MANKQQCFRLWNFHFHQQKGNGDKERKKFCKVEWEIGTPLGERDFQTTGGEAQGRYKSGVVEAKNQINSINQ